jgi:hypothetical protein
VFGQQQHSGGDADGRRGRGGEAQPDQRIQPIRFGGNGYPAVVAVGVARIGPVDHHDVLTRPERGEPAPFRGDGYLVDDVAPGAGADAEGMQSESHVRDRLTRR